MIRAKHGLLERQSLENTVLMGDGEDLSGSCEYHVQHARYYNMVLILNTVRMPVFTRPGPATRSRSSTCTSSSGAETPPLSISDGYSSFSDGSLSSIDLSQLNTLLSSTTHPLSNAAFDRARPPTRGHRHRHRISQARASRTSIYEIIEEELNSSLSPMNSFEHTILGSASNTAKLAEAMSKTVDPPQVCVMDSETSSVDSFSLWDDDRGITALRRYYALRDEAEDAITESKRTWEDTPFSVFTVQCKSSLPVSLSGVDKYASLRSSTSSIWYASDIGRLITELWPTSWGTLASSRSITSEQSAFSIPSDRQDIVHVVSQLRTSTRDGRGFSHHLDRQHHGSPPFAPFQCLATNRD